MLLLVIFVSIVDDLFLRDVSIGNVLFLRDVSIAGVLFLRDFLILQRAMLKDPSGPKPFPISFLLVSK